MRNFRNLALIGLLLTVVSGLFINLSAPVSDINTIDLEYSYNLEEDVTAVADYVNSANNQVFAYDGISRVTKAEYPNGAGLLPTGGTTNLGGTITYTKTGNILTYTEFGKATNVLTYDVNERLIASSGPEARAYTYDDFGNITSNSKLKFIYDSANNLTTVQNATGAKIVDYVYDGAGNRVKKVMANGRTTYYFSSNNQLIYEGSAGANQPPVSKEYFYLQSHAVGTREIVGCLTACTPAVENRYMHFNPARSTIGVSKQNGEIIRERYNVYGSHLATQQSGPTNTTFNSATSIRFAGHVTDDESGLSYMGARYYDPMIGRFLGVDPAGFTPSNAQSFNKYAYANNNPNKFIDPDGNDGTRIIRDNINRTVDFSKPMSGVADVRTGALALRNWGTTAVVDTVMRNGGHAQILKEDFHVFMMSESKDLRGFSLEPKPGGRFDIGFKSHSVNAEIAKVGGDYVPTEDEDKIIAMLSKRKIPSLGARILGWVGKVGRVAGPPAAVAGKMQEVKGQMQLYNELAAANPEDQDQIVNDHLYENTNFIARWIMGLKPPKSGTDSSSSGSGSSGSGSSSRTHKSCSSNPECW